MKTFTPKITDPRFFDLVGTTFEIEELFDGAIWAEGPAWSKAQQALYFSDVKGCTMYRWTQKDGMQIFRQPSYFSNGNAIDVNDNLITCEHGNRGISLTTPNGDYRFLVGTLDGKRLNSPNDVVVRSDGTIWFTDPPYGILSDNEGKKSASEIIGCYVYCYDPKTDKLNIATFNTMRPNGLAFSPDEKQLYVADMSSVEFDADGLHHLVVFDVAGNKLTNRRDVVEINPGIPDGFRIKRNGVIFCSCEEGIIALLPDGTELGRFVLGKPTSNCSFGDDENTLFITCSNSVYRLTMK